MPGTSSKTLSRALKELEELGIAAKRA